MDQDIGGMTSTERTDLRGSIGEALSTGWSATIGAMCLGWPYLLVLAGGAVVAGLAYDKNGMVKGEFAATVCIATFVILGCVSSVHLARIAVSRVGARNVRRSGWADHSRTPIQRTITAVVWSITSAKDLIVVAVVGLLFFPRFGMAFRFAVCEGLTSREALAKSWRVTNGRVQEIMRVAGTVSVAIGACLVLLTGILAVVLGKNTLGPAEANAVKWAHFLFSMMTIGTGLVWMNASVSAIFGSGVTGERVPL
ncbi:MAG: hypothetical protein DRQ45_05825 [Gammaproteobacteria bacterium]|nr:MAG: hypothetical protein DRQ45_05825 [Gammaproteobacteria bacterium]